MNILLVHGIFDNGRIYRKLAGQLTACGHHCFSPSLVPNDACHGIADLATKLDGMVNETFGADEPMAIVGFSMGCLVSRYYIHRLHAGRRTKAFFAISGPHAGSMTAYFCPGQGARDMRPGSSLLRDLDSAAPEEHDFPIFTYWTPLDLMILPATSSRWHPAKERIIWSPLHRLMPSNNQLCSDVVEKMDELSSQETFITTPTNHLP